MVKNLKIKIKNTQIAKALNLKKIKLSAAGKKKTKKISSSEKKSSEKKKKTHLETTETLPKRKARIIPSSEISSKKLSTKTKETPSKKEAEKKPKKKLVKKEKKKPAITKETTIKEEKNKKEPLKEEEKPTGKEEKKKEESSKEKTIEEKKKYSPKEYKTKKLNINKTFDARDRMGLRTSEEEGWRKKRLFRMKKAKKQKPVADIPKTLSIKLPISIKDLANSMKLKASEFITKLFAKGMTITINDVIDDETTVQLLGSEFDCDITIDTTEEKKLQMIKTTIKEEIKSIEKEKLRHRPPVVTFMGHVDHGKTSIIDRIRSSNIASQEAGAITQHIGAFTATTSHGNLTILDTPGHEAFSEMRTRGALITDIVILVIAGDEGIREQTIEAINQAKANNVPIIVAINKSDKKGYDPEKIYRQLSEYNLVPEPWGGTTITVNCSALNNTNINELLEMIALQAEILELKANPFARARGTILESELHKGLGAVATILVQNGTLNLQDSFVFETHWGKIKNMYDQNGKAIKKATPSTPIKITGLSTISEAGSEFIVVKDEKEAKQISHDRAQKYWQKKIKNLKKSSIDQMLLQQQKKILPIILKADMQGSLEALINALKKIESKKVELNFISEEVGEISESDIHLAYASNAPIIGFHTHIETNADSVIKKLKVKVFNHEIIYHAVDSVKQLMQDQLEKLEEEKQTGKAIIKTIFKSSQLGNIAGCIITDGLIKRGQTAKLIRNDEMVWKGKINSLKRKTEDVKEVQKGLECGIILENFSAIEENDIIQAFDITFISQEL